MTAPEADAPAESGDASATATLTGKLSRDALKRLLLVDASRLHLTPVQAYAALTEAEPDDDGLVEYGAFLLRAVPLIVAMCSPMLEKQREAAAVRAGLTPVAVISGRRREILTEALVEVFQVNAAPSPPPLRPQNAMAPVHPRSPPCSCPQSCDANKDGVLSREEFAACLRDSKLALKESEMQALFAAADQDQVRSIPRG